MKTKSDLAVHLQKVQKRPGMYFHETSYDLFCYFLIGVDFVLEGEITALLNVWLKHYQARRISIGAEPFCMWLFLTCLIRLAPSVDLKTRMRLRSLS
jgi:hypothetical protein